MNFMMRPCDEIVTEQVTKKGLWEMGSCMLEHVAKSRDASFQRQDVCGRVKVEACSA